MTIKETATAITLKNVISKFAPRNPEQTPNVPMISTYGIVGKKKT
jgi:hypothetical protein